MSPRQPVKFSDLDKSHMQHGGLLNKHYKSMGTIRCQSNQSSYPTGIKKTFVEANVLSMYAKFQLHPLYGF